MMDPAGNNDTFLKDENAASRHGFKEKYLGREYVLGIRTGQETQSCHGMTGSQVFAE